MKKEKYTISTQSQLHSLQSKVSQYGFVVEIPSFSLPL
ncbi:hypothetical protein M098_1029 [Phocaeicola vulgatus str. 3775 SR(B) 19]|nr:hypothetical protein M098_1029 [Phocaeicola vulgatus str. 3775 SR(B) 19]